MVFLNSLKTIRTASLTIAGIDSVACFCLWMAFNTGQITFYKEGEGGCRWVWKSMRDCMSVRCGWEKNELYKQKECEWGANGMRMGHEWSANGVWMGCEWGVNGVWMGCEWGVNGVWMGCEWGVNGVWMGCEWGTNGARMGCEWGVNGVWMGRERGVNGAWMGCEWGMNGVNGTIGANGVFYTEIVE